MEPVYHMRRGVYYLPTQLVCDINTASMCSSSVKYVLMFISYKYLKQCTVMHTGHCFKCLPTT